jgi:hypothetical protein
MDKKELFSPQYIMEHYLNIPHGYDLQYDIPIVDYYMILASCYAIKNSDLILTIKRSNQLNIDKPKQFKLEDYAR